MPQPATANGPWGEAIRYWLNKRHMRQADLVRAVSDKFPDDAVTPNTISNVTRGFPTTTRVLAKIAVAFGCPLDEVLVSPERRLGNDKRRKLASEISEEVLRIMDTRHGSEVSLSATAPHTDTDPAKTFAENIDELEFPQPRRRSRKPSTTKPKSRKIHKKLHKKN